MAFGALKQTLQPLSQQQIERMRRESERDAAAASQVQRISHPLQAIAQILEGGIAGWEGARADRAEADNRKVEAGGYQEAVAALLKGDSTSSSTAETPSMAGPSVAGPAPASRGPSPSSYAMGDTSALGSGIVETAGALGIDPVDWEQPFLRDGRHIRPDQEGPDDTMGAAPGPYPVR